MFEQESYDKATVQAESQPGDLFNKYEIKSWEFSPLVYKILAASAILHIAVLAFIAQTNILTMRGCDNPWAGRVCQVLDMAYVGAMIFGTEREYVDEVYEKTDLGEAEITYIDVTGQEPPLTYPEGYFQIANPVQYAMLQQQAVNGTDGTIFPGVNQGGIMPIPNNDGDLLRTKPNYPAANPNAFKDDSTTPLFKEEGANTGTVVRRKGNGGKTQSGNNANSTPTSDGEKVADANTNPQPTPTVSPTGPVEAVKINREVMRDFGKGVAEKLDKKEVDLAQNFKVTAVAVLTEEGKFDVTIDPKTKLQKSRVLTGEGDPAMVKVVTEAIAAIGDSGWLGYLSQEGIRNITFTFEQNDQELTANIVSEERTSKRAEMLSKALTNAISLRFALEKLNPLGDDEKKLLQAATSRSDGKKVVLNFKFPKADAQEMIQRNIQKAREAETGKKVNGQVQESLPNSNSTQAVR